MGAPSFPQPRRDLVQPPTAWKAWANQLWPYFRPLESSFCLNKTLDASVWSTLKCLTFALYSCSAPCDARAGQWVDVARPQDVRCHGHGTHLRTEFLGLGLKVQTFITLATPRPACPDNLLVPHVVKRQESEKSKSTKSPGMSVPLRKGQDSVALISWLPGC